MKSRKNKGYKIQSYGRIFDSSERRRKKRLKNSVLFVLAILVLVFVGYSISGPLTNLLKGEKTPRPSDSSSKLPVSSQTASSEVAKPEEPAAPTLSELKTAYLPLSVAANAESIELYIEKVKSQGFNAVVLELKDEDGTVYYNTKNEMAASVNAISETAIQNLPEIIAKLKSENIVPIANIHAFKDKLATRNSEAKILYTEHEGWSWYDAANGKPWLNPYSSAAQGYITSLVCELADMGFENVMVSSIMFPRVNSFVNADFGEMEKTVSHADILTQYAKTLKDALNAKGAKLLICYDAFEAEKENNVIYGGGNPKTYVCDALVPEMAVYTENRSQITEVVNSLKSGATPIMPKFVFAETDSVTKEQIDAQNAICADCSAYFFDKNGNYIG